MFLQSYNNKAEGRGSSQHRTKQFSFLKIPTSNVQILGEFCYKTKSFYSYYPTILAQPYFLNSQRRGC